MKKYGFTLAEVLITLGLIGVVAALTMPGLTANTQKAQVGPALAKVVSVLENANRLILSDNNAGSLDEVCGINYINCIQRYVPGSVLNADTAYTEYDLWTDYLALGDDGVGAYATDDGMTIITYTDGLIEHLGQPPKYYGSSYRVYIDTNGFSKNPNALGRDLFYFDVDGYGKVIPHGGRAAMEITGDSFLVWEDGECDASGVSGSGGACAGSIADNGWKVIY